MRERSAPKNQLIIALGCNCTMQIPTSKSFRTFNLSLSRRNDKKNSENTQVSHKNPCANINSPKIRIGCVSVPRYTRVCCCLRWFSKKIDVVVQDEKTNFRRALLRNIIFSSVECGNVHWSSNHLQLSICGREGREGVSSPMDDSTRAPHIPTLA